MNACQMIARLTRDPELRYLNGGTAVCKVGIAYNERFKAADGEWKERANFFDVTIWGKRGEAFAKFHKKGSMACFEGSLRYEEWNDKQTGAKRSRVYISAHAWHFVWSKQQGEGYEQRESHGSGGSDEPYRDASFTPQRDAGFTADSPMPMDIDDTPF